MLNRLILAGILALCCSPALAASKDTAGGVPRLEQRHGATQLVVDGAPFLVRGGELENSSASSFSFMQTVWPKLAAMHLNTVLAPAYWDLIEPKEGQFDFKSIDGLIAGARQNHMRLVLLWFGSWKNSMSSYVPAWVKRDQMRFPRAERSDGSGMEILSALNPANLEADATAFAALMRHLRETDGAHTVIMVQVENEVGMIPEARDHSAAANSAFTVSVPAALMNYLTAHRATLTPELKAAWEAHGAKTSGNWEEVFGAGPATDELFTAWTEGSYTGKVAAKGKAEYPLPLFVNAALVRPGRLPGQYPSGGPLPWLFDIWHAAAPEIDFLSPDLYFPNFVEWAVRYARPDNPYFIPETGRVSAADMAANGFYAYAQLASIGFSPYAPEFLAPDEMKRLGQAYDVIAQLTPLILANQGTAKIAGVRAPTAFDGTVNLDAQQVTMGGYTFDIHFKLPPPVSVGQAQDIEVPGAHGGLIIQTGPEEFLVAGSGIAITFRNADGKGIAGIESIREGQFVKGGWVPGRELNGDDNNQGRNLRLPSGEFAIRKVRLYRYR